MRGRRIVAMDEWREQPRPRTGIAPIDPRADNIVRWARRIEVLTRWTLIVAVPVLVVMVGWANIRGLLASGMQP